MSRRIIAGTGIEYYRRAKIAGEDVADTIEQEPENIKASLSAHNDDAKSLLTLVEIHLYLRNEKNISLDLSRF